ncbi:MAG: hypothetical protein MR426_14470 [Clostridiales bacterium]|nr:hypothetical protein [Clostridiales bacterium]
MKRLTALFILTALVACSIFPAVAEEKDYEAVYAPVLASIADLLSCENPVEHVSAPGETGIYEFRMGTTPEDALRKVGYTLQDLNSDSIPELIIAQVDSQEGTLSHGKQILAVYSCIQSSPHLLLEGWARNRFYLLSDGSFLNQGSGGAAYSCLGLFRLDTAGTELSCLDFFFTWEEDDQIVTYHNTDGTWEVPHEGNEQVELDFWRMNEILESDIQTIELTTFALYEMEEHPSLLLVQWNPYEELEDCVILSSEEYSAQIILYACQGTVSDLQLLSLEFEDVDQEGNVRFRQSVLKTIPSLEPGDPLAIQLVFGCAIPNFGVRYTDDTGMTRTFSIMQSGMDGSLLMTEIE